ncbi:unnamed protein product [Gongylonema pulchrum]|uniref:EGF-like domain-containing protein n=1 Tax=Gongylonema pulchrum TaxID=637853 RepID=A0A183CY52_9BILA|nr:unnamed protein product [Gongylonema pulchrum]
MHDGNCDRVNGTCKCAAGWTGPACEFVCPFQQYGVNCAEKCNCLRGASCNRTDGTCHCLPGSTDASALVHMVNSVSVAKSCVFARMVQVAIRLVGTASVHLAGEDVNVTDVSCFSQGYLIVLY